MSFSNLRKFLISKTQSGVFHRYNKHLRSLLKWSRYLEDVKEIVKLCPKNGLILDVGCGFGQLTEMLYSQGLKTIGIDLEKFLRFDEIWKNLHDIYIYGSGLNLPFRANIFDAVVLFAVIEHVEKQKNF